MILCPIYLYQTVKNKTNYSKKIQTFWNENLATAWSNVWRSESEYLLFKANKNGNLAQRNNLKNIYKNFQNIFDSKFRYFKRKSKKKEFEDLETLAKDNPAEMWEKLKQLSNPPSTRAALEIVREGKSISNDIK